MTGTTIVAAPEQQPPGKLQADFRKSSGSLVKQNSRSSLFDEVQVQDLPLPGPRSRRTSVSSVHSDDQKKMSIPESDQEEDAVFTPMVRQRSSSSASQRHYTTSTGKIGADQNLMQRRQKITNDPVDTILTASRQVADAYAKPARPKRTCLKVLIVEDNPINQKTAQKMVKLVRFALSCRWTHRD